MQGVQFLFVAVRNFEDSDSSENETLFISSLCLWWGSMIDATLIRHPEAMCKAVKDLANELKGENLSRIRSGLREKVCACVCLCLFRWRCMSVHMCLCTTCLQIFKYGQYYLCSKQYTYVRTYAPNLTLQFVRRFEEEMKIMTLSQFVVYLKSLTIIRSEVCTAAHAWI